MTTWALLTDLLTRVGAALVNAGIRRGADARWAHEDHGRPVHTHLSGGKLVVRDRRKAAQSWPMSPP